MSPPDRKEIKKVPDGVFTQSKLSCVIPLLCSNIHDKSDDSSEEINSNSEIIESSNDRKEMFKSSKRKLSNKMPVKELWESYEESDEENPPKKSCPDKKDNKNASSAAVASLLSRKFPESKDLSTAVRLHKDNVSAEIIEAILFDSLDGVLIIAEYQNNGLLLEASQQSLTNLLIYRSTESLLTFNKINDYFDKLSNAIIELFPAESKGVYYVPAKSEGNTSKNPKGKLPDKWRNTLYLLRQKGLLPKKTNQSTLSHY